jgi:hypothetical protein
VFDGEYDCSLNGENDELDCEELGEYERDDER